MDTTSIINKSFRWRTRKLPWYPRRGTRYDLVNMFARLGFLRGAEIGTQYGRFAEALCKASPTLKLLCVDPWSNYQDGRQSTQQRQDSIYASAIETLKVYNIEIRRQTSMESVKDVLDSSLDFVYIDGNHEFDYAMLDLIHWSRKVRSGGIVALHDYSHLVMDVVHVVDSYTASHSIHPWYITRETLPTAFWVQK